MYELSDKERRAFNRGIWTGWKRGVDSHVKWGPILQQFIIDIAGQAALNSGMPEKWQMSLRKNIKDLHEEEVYKLLHGSENLSGCYDLPWNPLEIEE